MVIRNGTIAPIGENNVSCVGRRASPHVAIEDDSRGRSWPDTECARMCPARELWVDR